jgi:hypothetical protein
MSNIVTDRPTVVSRRFENEPRVQLLPGFVAQRAKNRSAVRLGIMLVILGGVTAGGLYVYGVFRAASAEFALIAANATTLSLLEQQTEYRIATDTAAMVEQTSELQLVATAYEIDWAVLIQEIKSYLPEGGLFMNFDATNQAPWEGSLEIEDPLRTPRIAMIDFTISTKSVQDATKVVERLSEIEGFADAVVVSVAVGVDGRVTTTIALTLATDAVSGRFLVTDDSEATEGDETSGEDAADESTDAVDGETTEDGSED